MIRLTPKDFDLLEAIQDDRVTWSDCATRRSYRWWTSETEYTPVTQRVQRLIAVGLVTPWAALWATAKGGVELTPAGVDALHSESEDDQTRRMGFRGYEGCPRLSDPKGCPTPASCGARGDCNAEPGS